MTTERIWVHVPAVWLEASPTLNGANGRENLTLSGNRFTEAGVVLHVTE